MCTEYGNACAFLDLYSVLSSYSLNGFNFVHVFRLESVTMSHHRPQSLTPLSGGDLALPSNYEQTDYLRLEDSAMPWYPRASPAYEDIVKGEYELAEISG